MNTRFNRREFLQRAALVSAGAGLGGSLLTACGGATQANGGLPAPPSLNRDRSTLVFAVDAFEPDFDPASYYVNATAYLSRNLYEGLLRMKPGDATHTEPALATSFQPTPDFSSWTFTLRNGVQFTDGTPLDATAVKTAYVRSINLALGAGSVIGTFVADPDTQIVVVNPSTIRFDLGQPVAYFNRVVASIWGTGVTSPKVLQFSTGSTDQGHQWLQSHAAGTGPYMLESVSPGSQATLVQNPNYWGGWKDNSFKRIILQQIPDGGARREALQSGAVDMAIPSLTAQDTVTIRDDKRFNVASRLAMWIQYVVLGTYGPLASPQARQAVNYLYPADAYINDVMKNTMAPAHGCFPDLLTTHNPRTYTFPTDVSKAKQLFSQAGVSPGTQFTYEFYTGYGDLLGDVMQSQFQKAGMSLKLVQKAFPAFNADQTTPMPVGQRSDMLFFSWYPDYNHPADYMFPIMDSKAIPPNGYNSGYYANTSVDNAISRGYFVSNATQLQNLFNLTQDIINRTDPVWLPVGNLYDNTYSRNDVGGFVPQPLTGGVANFYPMFRT